MIADIAISVDQAAKNASIFATTLAFELNLYVVHAALHLSGYDDHTKTQLKLMRKKELKYAYSKD